MANVTVIGSQWGDEGKGKIVDWLASRADAVVRFQGGHNAGHTLVVGEQVYKLSLLPSGIVTGTLSIIGNGVVLDPWALRDEITKLRGQGVEINADNCASADNCALILPFQRAPQTLDLVENPVDSLSRHRRRREGGGALFQFRPAAVDLVVEFSLFFRRRFAVTRLPRLLIPHLLKTGIADDGGTLRCTVFRCVDDPPSHRSQRQQTDAGQADGQPRGVERQASVLFGDDLRPG